MARKLLKASPRADFTMVCQVKEKPKLGYTSGLKVKASQDLGYVLHHIDPALRSEDPKRYALWSIDDLQMLSRADHTRLHQKDKRGNRRSGATPLDYAREVSCFCVRPALLEAADDFTFEEGRSVSTLVRAGLDHFMPMVMSDDWTQLRQELEDLDMIYKRHWMQREQKEPWYMMLSTEEKYALKAIEIAAGTRLAKNKASVSNYSLSHLVELFLVKGII